MLEAVFKISLKMTKDKIQTQLLLKVATHVNISWNKGK